MAWVADWFHEMDTLEEMIREPLSSVVLCAWVLLEVGGQVGFALWYLSRARPSSTGASSDLARDGSAGFD